MEFFYSKTTVLKNCMQAYVDTHAYTRTHRTSVMLHNFFHS